MGWRDGWTFHPANSREKEIHVDAQLQQPDGHNMQILWGDFLSAIESNRKPACDIESSHRASVLPLLGMISYKVGRGIHWDGTKENILSDPDANALLKREYRGEWEYPV